MGDPCIVAFRDIVGVVINRIRWIIVMGCGRVVLVVLVVGIRRTYIINRVVGRIVSAYISRGVVRTVPYRWCQGFQLFITRWCIAASTTDL